MSRRRRMLIVVWALTIALMLNFLVPLALPSIPSVRATSRTIWLVGYAYAWNKTNPPITVTQGDTITVNLSTGDGIAHDFYVDVDNDTLKNCPPDAGCSAQFYAGHNVTVTFTVNFAPGTYKYICSLHAFSQKANFIVQPLPDFSLASNPTSLTTARNSSSTSTISVTTIGTFSGNVTLSASVSPTGPSMSLSPGMVTLSSTAQSATSTLTVAVPAGTTLATYTVVVTGSNGTVLHTTRVQVTVSANGGSSSGNTGGLFIPVFVGVVAGSLIAIAVATVYIYRRRQKPISPSNDLSSTS